MPTFTKIPLSGQVGCREIHLSRAVKIIELMKALVLLLLISIGSVTPLALKVPVPLPELLDGESSNIK